MGRGKGGKGGGGGGDGGGGLDDSAKHKLQAVLLADTFNEHFRPLSFDEPKVLCPLVNVPVIDYSLELLASNGVEEVFVFCVSHAKKVSDYLAASQWGQQMEIQVLSSTNCMSEGDALREIDHMGVVHSDPFVLIHGDVVSNMDLRSVIEDHKVAKKADQNKIMTMCMAKAHSSGSLRPVLDDLVVGLDEETHQVVLFNNEPTRGSVSVASELFKEHGRIAFHSDMLDCRVDVCSPEVLVQISDNFDYQDLRQDFVANEVANFELGPRIMAHVIGPREYCTRVDDFRLYHPNRCPGAGSIHVPSRQCQPHPAPSEASLFRPGLTATVHPSHPPCESRTHPRCSPSHRPPPRLRST